MSEYIIDYELIPLKWRDGYGLSDTELTEEIVRCRDCKHLNKLSREHEVYECCLTYTDVTLNGFCAWGERREP